MLNMRSFISKLLVTSALHDEDFYIAKVEDSISGDPESDLSFSTTQQFQSKKRRPFKDHSRLLDKYLSGEDFKISELKDCCSHSGCQKKGSLPLMRG